MVHFYNSENELTTATCMDIRDAQKHNVRGEKKLKGIVVWYHLHKVQKQVTAYKSGKTVQEAREG